MTIVFCQRGFGLVSSKSYLLENLVIMNLQKKLYNQLYFFLPNIGYSLYNNYKEWCWICVSIFFIDIFLLIACLFPDSL